MAAAATDTPMVSAAIPIAAAAAGCSETARRLAISGERAALATTPPDAVGLLMAGRVFFRLGDTNAVRRIQRALDQDPSPVATVASKALADVEADKLATVWDMLHRGDTTARDLLVEIEAAALADDPGSANLLTNVDQDYWKWLPIARAWETLGEPHRAATFAARALEAMTRGPVVPPAVLEVAEVLSRHGDVEWTDAALALHHAHTFTSFAHLAVVRRNGARELLERGKASVMAAKASGGGPLTNAAFGRLAIGFTCIGRPETALDMLAHVSDPVALRQLLGRLARRIATERIVSTPKLQQRLAMLRNRLSTFSVDTDR